MILVNISLLDGNEKLTLVMPTFFGPTNSPPLEAFSLGVPILYSDLIGLKDIVAAALFLDLDDPGSLAQNLKNLIPRFLSKTYFNRQGNMPKRQY